MKWKGKTGMKTIFYPLSKDRFNFIETHYPKYLAYLATIFSDLAADNVQILTILPGNIRELQNLSNIINLPALPYDDFLSLINASDLYLTDSFISCIVEAIQLETPALLLINSKTTSLPGNSFFTGQVFPFWVWPYGMDSVCMELERLFELEQCYIKNEMLNKTEVLSSIRELLFSKERKNELISKCRKWKSKRKENLATPTTVLNKILKNHPFKNHG
jgi:hypothetical protein